MKGIFLVDDSRFARTMLRSVLSKNGYRIVGEARTCTEAAEKLEYIDPDVVILDLLVDEKDGVEALKKIKKLKPCSKVIVCSVLLDKALVLEAFSEGASECIQKPFSEYVLLKAIQNAG